MAFDELVRRFMAGDPDALDEMELQFGPRTRAILRRRFAGLLRRLEIDDVLQLAKLRAWRDRPKFDSSHGSLAAWFFSIARHAGQELANSDWARQRQQETESDFKQTISPQRAAQQSADAHEGDGLSLSSTLAALNQALSTLTDRQRQILMAKANDVSTEELAAEYGVSQSTIRNTEAQAMKKLRAELTKLGHPPPPRQAE